MLSRVLETISRYNMLPPGVRVIVAVSGGADSVCLLHVLAELAPQSLAGVAHFNHQWRAAASDEDERFVAALASQFSIPFFRGEMPPAPQGNLEQEARRARQKFFSTLDATIALGHTRDDQSETVLFRFLRGSGLTGLAAIPPASGNIIRPLLDVTRSEIEHFLRSRHVPWREDSTNADPRFARNRIRHHLLPQLARDWNPQIAFALAKLADLASEEEHYWAAEIDRLAAAELRPCNNAIELRADRMAALPKAVARRLVRRAISDTKSGLRRIEYDHVEAVLNLKRSLRLPGLTVTRSFDWLRFAPSTPIPSPATLEIAGPGIYPSPDGLTRICVRVAQSNPCATLRLEQCLPLVLRGWRSGDHYRPHGHDRDRKIQEMFQKARIPSWRRASWPIIASRDEILWSRQFGLAEGAFLEVLEMTLS